MKSVLAFLLIVFVGVCLAEVYFKEEFNDGWEKRWVKSKFKEAEGTNGEFAISAGTYFGDEEEQKGLKTTKDARFYQISAQTKEFSNKGKTLVLQYSVKHEQNIDCGGGYVKLLPAGLDQTNFNGDSAYNVMFGPDICGTTKRVHVIFNYKGKNHLVKKEIRCESDTFTHVYTLVVKPDNTYQVLIDNKEVESGSLAEDWDMLPPKEILDPKQSKPSDWVDEKEIPDPNAVKPDGWDDIPKEIKDPEASKPEDWDNDLDGEWEAPLISNPEYKGEWKAPLIPNPSYKGEWVHPKIANPEYFEDNNLYAYDSHKYLGIEIWQVKSGTIFDNFLVTDDLEEAKELAERAIKAQAAEKAASEKDAAKAASAPPTTEDVEEEEEDAGESDLKDEL
jgi:calreticulin